MGRETAGGEESLCSAGRPPLRTRSGGRRGGGACFNETEEHQQDVESS